MCVKVGVTQAAILFPLQRFVSRRGELHADRQPGAEEAGVPVPDELRQEPT